MPSRLQPRHADRQARVTAYDVLSLLIIVFLVWLTVASAAHQALLGSWRSEQLSATVATASFLLTLGLAYVAIAQFMLQGRMSSLLIGAASCTFAAAHLLLQLVPLLSGRWPQLGWSVAGWGVEDVSVAILLLAAVVYWDVSVAARYRLVRVLAGLTGALTLSTLVTICVYLFGTTAAPGHFRGWIPAASGVLLLVMGIYLLRYSKRRRAAWLAWIAAGVAAAGFARFQFSIHGYPLSIVHSGNVLQLLGETSILVGLIYQWILDQQDLRWKEREFLALQALSASSGVHDIPTMVQHVARVASEALGTQVRVFVTHEGKHQWPELPAEAEESSSKPPTTVTELDRLMREFPHESQSQVLAGFPLGTSSGQHGALIAVRDDGDDFSVADLQMLRSYGTQASILLERYLLYEEIAAGAVLQERSRLAREIHDGLAQHLAFLKMRVAWLKRMPPDIGFQQLDDVENVLETALIEARHAITTLRSEPQGTSTVEAIERYVEEFTQVSGLEAAVQVEEGIPEVGPKVRVELLRVVQEAMNNVRKHARASNIEVRVRARRRGIEISVVDDGAGFETSASERGHFGLEIMQERANSVNGTLTVSSEPRAGTTVSVWVPTFETESGNGAFQPLSLIES